MADQDRGEGGDDRNPRGNLLSPHRPSGSTGPSANRLPSEVPFQGLLNSGGRSHRRNLSQHNISYRADIPDSSAGTNRPPAEVSFQGLTRGSEPQRPPSTPSLHSPGPSNISQQSGSSVSAHLGSRSATYAHLSDALGPRHSHTNQAITTSSSQHNPDLPAEVGFQGIPRPVSATRPPASRQTTRPARSHRPSSSLEDIPEESEGESRERRSQPSNRRHGY
jgi:hypothetical protein